MKKLIFFTLFCLGNLLFSQTITFKGCLPLFDDQNFTFNKTATDSFGKNIYITTPIDSNQPCGGIGTCEFKLQWNNVAGRWELLADTGNGNFVNPYLIYYSSTQNTSAINPPNAAIGTWLENSSITTGACGGNLTTSNSTFTGDVRSVTLEVNEFSNSQITIYPNPATDFINISGLDDLKLIKVVSLDGKLISTSTKTQKINISKLTPGVYLLEIQTDNTTFKRIKFIKK